MKHAILALLLQFASFAQTYTSSATNYVAEKYYTHNVPYCTDPNTASWGSWTSSSYQNQPELTIEGYINPASDESGCYNRIRTNQFIIGFNTSFIGSGGSIVSAYLYWKPVSKVKPGNPANYGLYIRTVSGDSTSYLTYPENAPSTSDIVTNRSIDSITTGSYAAETVPTSAINKTGTTYIHFYYRGIPTAAYSYYGGNWSERVTVGGPSSASNKPYLLITLAGGARLIVVIDQ